MNKTPLLFTSVSIEDAAAWELLLWFNGNTSSRFPILIQLFKLQLVSLSKELEQYLLINEPYLIQLLRVNFIAAKNPMGIFVSWSK